MSSVRQWAFAAMALVLASNLAIAAEDPAVSAPGHSLYGDPSKPDISGLWMGTYTTSPGYTPQNPVKEQDKTYWAPWPPPLTPAYQKLADEKIAAAKAGRAVGDAGARCLPFGLPRMFIAGTYPEEIIQLPGLVTIWPFGTFPIFVWTDGRPHPKNVRPSYNGDSVGYWVGDTLHVDTVGILTGTPIDSGPRTPHSDKLHMETTFRSVGPDNLHVQVTLYDADALTEPMVTNNIWRRKSGPNWQVLDDASCFENNKNVPDDTGATGFKPF